MKAIFLALLTTQIAFASELHMSEEEALKKGYKKIEKIHSHSKLFKLNSDDSIYAPHSLEWPFEAYDHNFLGNNFVQYQPYPGTKNGGYHGGNDMVLKSGSWVYAPVSGKLEAGHYSYKDFDNGGREKFWKPWPQRGASRSFEIALIDKNGLRFELHHIDRASMPQEIQNCLKQAPCHVKKGVKVGKVYKWDTRFHYDHIHLNIIDEKTGRWYNPEHFFKLIKDTIPPKIKILVESVSGKTFWLQENQIITEEVKNFTVVGSDQKDNSHFHQTPLFSQISFNEGDKWTYDYRYTLNNDFNLFPEIADIFPLRIRLPDGTTTGQRLRSSYYPLNAQYLIRLPIPANIGNGRYKITVKDIAGNETEFLGFYQIP